ncbi:MAG: hypothetical protein Q6351_009835 [Candidatus Njordarchaeum guaymaensis]
MIKTKVLVLSIILLTGIIFAGVSLNTYISELDTKDAMLDLSYIIKSFQGHQFNVSERETLLYGFVATLTYDGMIEYLSGITIQILVHNSGNAFRVGEVSTDRYGYFEYRIEKAVEKGYTSISLKFVLENNHIAVKNGKKDIFFTKMDRYTLNVSSGAISIYDPDNVTKSLTPSPGAKYVSTSKVVTYLITGPKKGAAMVFEHLYYASEFMIESVKVNPPKIAAILGFSSDKPRIYYDVETRRIFINSNPDYADWYDFSVVVHEYGHFIMDVYADLYPPYSICHHAWSAHTDYYTAWIEGWATFFQSVVKDWFGFGSAEYYIDSYIGIAVFNVSLEREYAPNKKQDFTDVEGAVAGFLWDIYDNVKDDQDNDGFGDDINLSFKAIWDVITKYDPAPADLNHNHPWTIVEFIFGLQKEYPNITSKLWPLMWEHGIRQSLIVKNAELFDQKRSLERFNFVTNYLGFTSLVFIVELFVLFMSYRRRRRKLKTFWLYEL